MNAMPEKTRSDPPVEIRFRTLIYRYFFFDWLFADMTKACGAIERHAAWQHNRAMRRYLPIYLRRWGVMSAFLMLAGGLCEKVLETALLAACCFTGSSMILSAMPVILVVWVFLSRP